MRFGMASTVPLGGRRPSCDRHFAAPKKGMPVAASKGGKGGTTMSNPVFTKTPAKGKESGKGHWLTVGVVVKG